MSNLAAPSNNLIDISFISVNAFGSEPTCEGCYARDADYVAILEEEQTLIKKRYCTECMTEVSQK